MGACGYWKGECQKNRFTDDVITHEKNEYSSHTLYEVVNGKQNMDWILVTRSRIGK